MTYSVVPLSKTAARQFIQEHHRHNEAPSPQQVAFAIGLDIDGVIVAVLTAGRPVARLLDDGLTLEVNRTCVQDYHRNANSFLYGACARAAKALGYKRLVTYTLTTESGSSLRGAGFGVAAEIKGGSWDRPNQPDRLRHDVTLWGERRQPTMDTKFRWEMAL